jgi:hypothetical protein
VVVVLRGMAQIQPDGISLLEFLDQLVLHLSVVRILALLPELIELLLQLLGLLGGLINHLGFCLIHDDLVRD